MYIAYFNKIKVYQIERIYSNRRQKILQVNKTITLNISNNILDERYIIR